MTMAAHLGRHLGATALEVDDTVAFPEAAKPGQLIKLPGQNRVTADEYQEFTTLGQGGIFDLDLDRHGVEKTPPPSFLAGTHTWRPIIALLLYIIIARTSNLAETLAYCSETPPLSKQDLTGFASWWHGTV